MHKKCNCVTTTTSWTMSICKKVKMNMCSMKYMTHYYNINKSTILNHHSVFYYFLLDFEIHCFSCRRRKMQITYQNLFVY